MKSGHKQPVVYIPMSADIIHPGHLNIIAKGAELGEVVVGLLSDEAIASKKRLPLMPYPARLAMMQNIKNVSRVIEQKKADYTENLKKLKPDYVVHGDDWHVDARTQVLDTIRAWGGKLVEVKYTDGISSTLLQKKLKNNGGISPAARQRQFKRLLTIKKPIRALEAHNGLSAKLVEETRLNVRGKVREFDAIWVSSLTDSYAKAKPDMEVVDRTSRLATINDILEATTKPILVDGDTGGNIEYFKQTVKTLDRLGVSGIVIEDKTGQKHNSLHIKSSDHEAEKIENFVEKIKSGTAARTSDEFYVIARIESLILGAGVEDALQRARAYIEAGVSALVIHSKNSDAKDIKQFCGSYAKFSARVPLILIPTSYSSFTADELSSWGADVVVYANHLLRAAYPAMQSVAHNILENDCALEADEHCIPIDEFLGLMRTEET